MNIEEALVLLNAMILGKEKVIEVLEEKKAYPITSDILIAQRLDLEHLKMLKELLVGEVLA